MSDNEFKKVEWSGDQWQPSDDDGADGLPIGPRSETLQDDDFELLCTAAQAIGAERVEEVEGENWVNLHFADGSTLWNWNPLMHGDDAFNLAADLGMQVFPTARTTNGQACAAVADPTGTRLAEDSTTADVRAATRRAIVRGAAEIAVARGNKQA